MSAVRDDPTRLRRIGLAAGPLLGLAVYAAMPQGYTDAGGAAVELTPAAHATASAAVWMAVWWMTEAIPIYATSLLPLALFPLTGAATVRNTAAPYGHELIFLFLGGFLLALTIQRWGLHRRVALLVLSRVPPDPASIVGGFMLVTALLSMWVSNTATAIAMLPIAVSVIQRVDESDGTRDPVAAHNFRLCLILSIAYGASIGGVGTLVGTPPNLFLASYARRHLGVDITFARWLLVGVPLVIVFLPLAWGLLTRVLYPLGRVPVAAAAQARGELARLGRPQRGEWNVLVVFVLTALAWMTRPLLAGVSLFGTRPLDGLTDTGIAIAAALALFVLPAGKGRATLDWETAAGVPFGILLLFGGGLSLAAAIQVNGLGAWVGTQVRVFQGVPAPVFVALVTALVIFLTELTSNTATTATLVPILAAMAPGLGLEPLLLAVPAALAASCAFMLPVATPPNAVVFASGHIRIIEMSRAGLWLNLSGIVLITALVYALVIPVFGL